MNSTPRIETERLILRKFTVDDAEALHIILSDKEVNRFLPWYPFEDIEQTKAHLQQFYLENYELDNVYRYAICLKSDDVPIGYVHVGMNESNDFGYGLRQEFWNNGIATEASQAVLEQLQKDGYRYITATHDINNPGSGGVMKKVGMTYRYTYEECWQPKNIVVTFRMYQLDFTADNCTYLEYWDKYPNHFIEEI